MASGKITANTPTDFQDVTGEPVHISLAGTFDSASVALEQDINGTTFPVLDVNGVAITYAVAVDDVLNFNVGNRIRLNPTGIVTAADIDFNLAGASIAR